MIKIVLELPEAELRFYFGSLRLWSAHHHKAVWFLPIPRLIAELRYLPAFFSESLIAQVLKPFLQGRADFGNYSVSNAFLVERFDELVVEKSRIGSDTDTIKMFGDLALNSLPKRLSSRSRTGISRSQYSSPTVSAAAFETKQRPVTGSPAFLGVVTYPGSLNLPAEDRQDSRIQVENKAGRDGRQSRHLPAQEVVRSDNPLQFRRTQTFQEFPQGGRLGKILQAQEMLKTVVVMQDFGVGDAFHPCYHRIEESQDQFGRMVKADSAPPSNMPLKESFEIQFSAKSLKNEHSAEERKGRILEGKPDIFDEFSHMTNRHPRGARLSGHFYSPDYNIFSSVIAILLLQKCQNSPFFQVKI
jgi:hypothetical protein